jgi:tetratricopeptide (TPR) repeat protein
MSLFRKKTDQTPVKSKGAQPAPGDVSAAAAPATDGPLEFSEKDQAKARKWFAQAKKLYDDRNFDYAIESYLNGLKFWPEAVEEGHQMLRVAAYARAEKGGKKAGTIEVMKRSMSGKDPLLAFFNAEWLWSRDPGSVPFIEGMVKNAARAGLEAVLLFIGPIYFDAIKAEKKISQDRLQLLRKSYEAMGERCERRGDMKRALTFFEGAMTVLQVLNTLSGHNQAFAKEVQDMATKVTMIKGKYGEAEDFRGSIKDAELQKVLHDRDRLVMDQDRLSEMITAARETWKASPGVVPKLLSLVELLVKKEDEARENEAVTLLEGEFQSSGNFQLKMRADDVRIRQLQRHVRQAEAVKDAAAVREAKVALLRLELSSWKGRVQNYPTDNKLKFRYGRLLMQAGQFDQAIPVLQEARNDPKHRVQCMSLIGRCFYEKGFHTQAITTYNQALSDYELTGDDLSKELHYWLGRACEAANKADEARAAYGQIIQWDYNYRDTRQRLAALGG